MMKWSVLIADVGIRVVEAEDIDRAYAADVAEYGCKLEDVLAVFCHTPFRSVQSETAASSVSGVEQKRG